MAGSKPISRAQKKPPAWRGNRRFKEALLLGDPIFRIQNL